MDRQLMARALELAARGIGRASPGPLVGTVIVDDSGEVVGEGFYLYDRVKHAETVALEHAGSRAQGATAYVSLEPHAHHGRTPPCAEALIKAGIKRVVAPIEDPNPKVSGRGFAHLRKAGIEVCTGLMVDEASQLNEVYIHFMRTGRPFVHLKMAVSLDGKVATRTGDSGWIAGEESRPRAHELGPQYDALLVGSGTVLCEGGGTLAGALMDGGLIDKVPFFIAPMIIGGLAAPTAVAGTGASRIKDAFQLEGVEVTQRGRDVEVTGYPSQNRPVR